MASPLRWRPGWWCPRRGWWRRASSCPASWRRGWWSRAPSCPASAPPSSSWGWSPRAPVVTVRTIETVAEPESPASDTREAASTPSDTTATTATAMIGAFQLEDVARRVRAAAPQFRHHSWSGRSGVAHSGQTSAQARGRRRRGGGCGTAGTDRRRRRRRSEGARRQRSRARLRWTEDLGGFVIAGPRLHRRLLGGLLGRWRMASARWPRSQERPEIDRPAPYRPASERAVGPEIARRACARAPVWRRAAAPARRPECRAASRRGREPAQSPAWESRQVRRRAPQPQDPRRPARGRSGDGLSDRSGGACAGTGLVAGVGAGVAAGVGAAPGDAEPVRGGPADAAPGGRATTV